MTSVTRNYWNSKIPLYHPESDPYSLDDSSKIKNHLYIGRKLKKRENVKIILWKIVSPIAISILFPPVIPFIACFTNIYRNTGRSIREVKYGRKFKFIALFNQRAASSNESSKISSSSDKRPDIFCSHGLPFFGRENSVTELEQSSIDELFDHLKNIPSILGDVFTDDLSAIHFRTCKSIRADGIRLSITFSNTLHSLFKKFNYRIDLNDDIRTDQFIGGVEEIIQGSLDHIQSIKEAIDLITKEELENKFHEVAARHHLKAKSLQIETANGSCDYNANTSKLLFPMIEMKYKGKWTDGKEHFNRGKPWNEHILQSEVFDPCIENVDFLGDTEFLFEDILMAYETMFDDYFAELKRDYTFNFPNFDYLLNEDEEGSLSEIEKALNEIHLLLGVPFTDLEVTENNLDQIKIQVKAQFKRNILLIHPDKTKDLDDTKSKKLITLYKIIEKNYIALGNDW